MDTKTLTRCIIGRFLTYGLGLGTLMGSLFGIALLTILAITGGRDLLGSILLGLVYGLQIGFLGGALVGFLLRIMSGSVVALSAQIPATLKRNFPLASLVLSLASTAVVLLLLNLLNPSIGPFAFLIMPFVFRSDALSSGYLPAPIVMAAWAIAFLCMAYSGYKVGQWAITSQPITPSHLSKMAI